MNDNRKLTELTVSELIEIQKDIPKTYFVDACREEWKKDLNNGIDEKVSDYTGVDVTTPSGKKHVVKVYSHAEASMESMELTKKTVVQEGVKTLFKYGWIPFAAYYWYTKQG